jgi:hypothetical protein
VSGVTLDSDRSEDVSLSTILNNAQLSGLLEEFADAHGSSAHLHLLRKVSDAKIVDGEAIDVGAFNQMEAAESKARA